MTIGERIKKIRDDHNYNQRDFAKIINVGQATLSMFETGERTPKDIHIDQICSKFGINKEWLETGSGDMESSDIGFSDICLKIGVSDEKAKNAIIDYWKLSDSDKELFWRFIDKFVKKSGD